MATIAPEKPMQLFGSPGGAADWMPPSWIRRTIAFTPCRSSAAAYRLAVVASSRNRRPATPVGVTIVGVDSSVSPMKPTLTLPNVFTNVGGSSGAGAGRLGATSFTLQARERVLFRHAAFFAASFFLYTACFFAYAARSAAVTSRTTFAERYRNLAPPNGSPSWQPSF